MTTIADTLAAFDAAVSAHGIGEHTKYYAVQRACVELAKAATATQQLALAEAAHTAERLAQKLEASCGDIRAQDEEYWRECASRLRSLIEMGGSPLSAGEIALRLADHRRFFESIRDPI